ncbi:MAG: amidohydrolase [Oscillospiraceae bacterium]|nr:amidohydrolase [Oscillospiraceae bacterium]MCD7817868.1 amidohydrolase [Lachnospiraceae bacterium]
MFIDAYSHAMPQSYKDALLARNIPDHPFIPPFLSDMEARRRALQESPADVQFVAVPMQLPYQYDLPQSVFADLAKIYNDGLAEMQLNNSDLLFATVASIPGDNVDNALNEARRAIEKLGMKGILLPCNCRGIEPSSDMLRPLLKLMASYNLPVWLHPWTPISGRPKVSASDAWDGWDMLADTSDAMLHLVLADIFEEEPNIKIIAHHGGAHIPFFHTRMKSQYFWRIGAVGNKYAPDFKEPDHTVAYRQYEDLKKFYVDTAFYGMCTPQIEACISFFGEDHVLFGSDYPLPSAEELPLAMQSVDELSDSEATKAAIRNGNIKRLLMA